MMKFFWLSKLYNTVFVFAGRHTRMFFENQVEMRDRIKAKLVGNRCKRNVVSDKFFCLVYLEFKIGLVNAHARFFLEEGAKVGLAVVQAFA